MAAVDYARLRAQLGRSRLLFVAHREEILDQSRATFRHALRDGAFGEKWVGGQRPSRFEHVFASIQSLNSADVRNIDPAHFDVVIVDEFHHAAAPSYEALLEHLKPVELLGLTATPERADGLDVLRYFRRPDRGRAAALGRDRPGVPRTVRVLRRPRRARSAARVPWRRGQGYDITALENVFTADHAWAHLVVEEIRRKVADPSSDEGARLLRQRRPRPLHGAALHGARSTCRRSLGGESSQTSGGLRSATSPTGSVRVVFTVDLFNEGIDIPSVDTLLLLRPTDSPTLFLQQLGRGLRKSAGKSACTVLDFVGTHRKEFRFDRRSARAARRLACRRRAAGPPGLSVPARRLQLPPRRGGEGDRARQHPRRDPEHVARAVRRASLARRCRARRVPREQRPRARGHLRRRPQLVGNASRGGSGRRAGRARRDA